jgi:uncharacterized membrane protein YbhN (UPF0104 family)
MATAAPARPLDVGVTGVAPGSGPGTVPGLRQGPALTGLAPDPPRRRLGLERGAVASRLLTVVLLIAALVSLMLAVPGLHAIGQEISHLGAGWLILAAAFELASCASFIVVFRHFFRAVPAGAARELAWTEMGSGALLPGGGVGSLAVGGWLLHLAGMPAGRIVRSSSGLFFLTSAVNVGALIGGGLLLASGLSAGQHDLLRAGLPILAGSLAIGGVLGLARLGARRSPAAGDASWVAQLISGVGAAEHALRHPSWRLAGAIGYLGFDIAVLWATLSGVGYTAPLAVLILGYIIGYLANLIPVPGAVGVLEGGLAGTLVLYGAPVTEATAGVLVYHAIAFWIPSIGGLLGYRRLRRHLAPDLVSPLPARPGGTMSEDPPTPGPAWAAPRSRDDAVSPPRSNRPRTPLRARHVEAHAVAWLRSLRDRERARPAQPPR